MPPRPGEDDRTGLPVVAEGERRLLDLLDVTGVEGIRLLRAAERHDGDAPPPLHLEVPVFHWSRVSEFPGVEPIAHRAFPFSLSRTGRGGYGGRGDRPTTEDEVARPTVVRCRYFARESQR